MVSQFSKARTCNQYSSLKRKRLVLFFRKPVFKNEAMPQKNELWLLFFDI
ncbi:hypothetical protein Runsl_4704 [Runella slithyformis DSM 19594]|uniref:Uncharacterized protein n=1 Tax=Runella slithyformis (strain ATCC 29530 / DSM 19594 / LMG 11500 / NCIMB 11436 / LSU 4) TaxID=761193 RepID=A0A7U3ZPN8_RUNSL|nr:hypothetical protein Runsl_4704 [Runella slithyformis DSM 19594]